MFRRFQRLSRDIRLRQAEEFLIVLFVFVAATFFASVTLAATLVFQHLAHLEQSDLDLAATQAVGWRTA